MNVVAMIPARIGSQRFPKKNLALIEGEPMLANVAKRALDCGVFDDVVINGDHDDFRELADSLDIKYYDRPKHLGTSTARSDDVVFDFMSVVDATFVCWVNPICPLALQSDYISVVSRLTATSDPIDSVFTCTAIQLQANFEGKPLNYSTEGKFELTQNLAPVEILNPVVMGWRVSAFMSQYKNLGHGFFCGKVGYVEVPFLSSLAVKTEADFRLVRTVAENRSSYNAPVTRI